MKTFRFSFKGRNHFIDAETIFAAMVEFHALYSDQLNPLDELTITKIP